MKLGINTFLFTARFQQQHVSLFKDIASIGYDGVEITYAEKDDFNPREVLSELKSKSLVCSALCPCQSAEMNLRGSDTEYRNAVDFFKESVDTAAALETDLISGPLYSQIGYMENLPVEKMAQGYKRSAEGLAEVAEYAAGKGVFLALEPLVRFETDFINTVDDALKLIELSGSNRIKIHLDTFHMNTEETNLELAMLKAGDKIFNIHASENNRGAPGSGTINWQAIKQVLVQVGYNRFINVETFHVDAPEISFAAAVRRRTSATQMTLAEESYEFLHGLFQA